MNKLRVQLTIVFNAIGAAGSTNVVSIVASMRNAGAALDFLTAFNSYYRTATTPAAIATPIVSDAFEIPILQDGLSQPAATPRLRIAVTNLGGSVAAGTVLSANLVILGWDWP